MVGTRKCCVPGCTSGVEVPNHKFPKDPVRCARWIESLKLHHFNNYTNSQVQSQKVCYKHFQSKDHSLTLHNRMLLSTAVPVPIEVFNVMALALNNTENILQQQPEQSESNISQNSHNAFDNSQEDRLQALERKFEALETNMLGRQETVEKNVQEMNKQFKLRQRIPRCLRPICTRLYEKNKKLKNRIKYLNSLKRNLQKRRKTARVPNTVPSASNTESAQQTFIGMIEKNKDLHLQVSHFL